MTYEELAMSELRVNKANDRHGEVLNEDLAIAELFRLHDGAMRKLASDLAGEGVIYDPPLVMRQGSIYVVFDGNRRVTCAKLLAEPARAPTTELRSFFSGLAGSGIAIPSRVICQIESNRGIIDRILHRRHTGSQGGIGQIDWNDRAKLNFTERTGAGNTVNVAAEIERTLRDANRLPDEAIPWSTLTRLLSSEEFRNRVGISTAGKRFRITRDREIVLNALNRITSDLSSQNLTLGDLWNNEGKRSYLNGLEREGVLPVLTSADNDQENILAQDRTRRRRAPQDTQRRAAPIQRTFIPSDAPHVQWTAAQQRLRAIWEELQILHLDETPNAVSVLMRILLELSLKNYIDEHTIVCPDIYRGDWGWSPNTCWIGK